MRAGAAQPAGAGGAGVRVSEPYVGGARGPRAPARQRRVAASPRLREDLGMGRPLSLRDSLPGLGRLGRRFWPYLRRERGLITVSLFALYAEIGLRLLEPWPLKWVLDRVTGSTRHRGLASLPFLDALDPATLLALSALAVIAFAALRALAAYYNTVGFALVGNRVLTSVPNELD